MPLASKEAKNRVIRRARGTGESIPVRAHDPTGRKAKHKAMKRKHVPRGRKGHASSDLSTVRETVDGGIKYRHTFWLSEDASLALRLKGAKYRVSMTEMVERLIQKHLSGLKI